MLDETIARLIRRKLTRGDLPPARPRQLHAGGCMAACICDACGQWIARGQTEFEAEYADGESSRYHGSCYQLLYTAQVQFAEREALMRRRRA